MNCMNWSHPNKVATVTAVVQFSPPEHLQLAFCELSIDRRSTWGRKAADNLLVRYRCKWHSLSRLNQVDNLNGRPHAPSRWLFNFITWLCRNLARLVPVVVLIQSSIVPSAHSIKAVCTLGTGGIDDYIQGTHLIVKG